MARIVGKGVSFDDVLLVPQRTSIRSRKDTDTSTFITKNIKLNIPMISLCMSTVTESKMAIAMALEGGMGIIHRFMTIGEQAVEVRKVKKSMNRIIEDPVTISEEATLEEAIRNMEENNDVTGLLVVDHERKLVGILTKRDFAFERDMKKGVRELMTKKENLITANSNIDIKEASEILKKKKVEKLPLVDEENKVKGLITIKDIIDLEMHKNACRDKNGRLIVGAAIGIKGDYFERAEALVKEGVDVLVIDVAHAHSDLAIEAVKKIKENLDVDLIAGNVATAKGTEELIRAGVDGVKIGIGNGTICTTRIVAGAGVPQMTALMDAVEVGRRYNIPIISDGGIATSGNFAKALAVGASAHMFGSVFAGTEETPGPIIYKKGKQFKQYHGSTSYLANVIKKERETKTKVNDFLEDAFVEGVESLVPYKGPVREVINAFMKGLRSGMTYCGARTIPEMWTNAEFIEISAGGVRESGAHDVLEI